MIDWVYHRLKKELIVINSKRSISGISGNSAGKINAARPGLMPAGLSTVAAVIFLSVSALPVHAAPSPASEQSLRSTVWRLQNWTRPDNSVRAVPPQEIPATLEFAPDNTIMGYTGCNSIAGKYSFMQDTLSIKTGTMSRRTCFTLPDFRFEREYVAALGAITQTRMLAGFPQKLKIILNNGERLEFSPFKQDADAPANSALRATEERIRNTKWTLKSWKSANGNMRELPTGPQSPSLNFFDKGNADGYTGCNTMQTSYAFANGQLRIQPGVTTLKSCEKTIRDQDGNRVRDNSSYVLEQDYLNALAQIRSADIHIASSTSQQLRLVIDNYDTLEFERNPGWMTEGLN
jgi:heat shock protein HslJ